MKRALILFFTLLTSLSQAQNTPNVISFEPGNYGGMTFTPVERDPIDNNYFGSVYGVTFHIGAPNSSNVPIIAEVGGAQNFAFVGPSGATYSSTNCTVPSNVTIDKPSNTLDVGCFFLTDDSLGITRDPESLYVMYDTDCSVASGYLLDVDGKPANHSNNTWQEGWKITAYPVNPSASPQTIHVLSPNYTFYPPMAGLTNFSPLTGDGEPGYWEVDLGNEIIDFIEFDYIGSPLAYVGIAFDEFNLCSSAGTDTTGCCGGQNLVPNGSFEAGNTGFISGYTNQSNFSANSIIPGQYGIVNSSQALSVSPQWNLTNHTTCTGTGNFMAVNGRTMGSTYGLVYYQTNIPVDPDKEYIFCYYYQHLSQCTFDVWDPRNLLVGFGGASSTLNECDSDDELCGWTKVSYTVQPTGNNISFALYLDERGIGDGNDFALDDISLKEKQIMPIAYHDFDISSSTFGNSFFMSGTALTNPLPFGFDVAWQAQELDCNTQNPIPGTIQTWTNSPYSTNFPGYCCNSSSSGAGIFSKGKCYRVTRTVSNCCYEDGVSGWEYQAFNEFRMAGVDEAESATGLFMSKDGETWIPVPEGDLGQKYMDSDPVNFQLFPNPGDGRLTLKSTNLSGKSHVTITDAQGKVIERITTGGDGNDMELNLTELPGGLYLIQLESEEGQVFQQKYIKQ